MNDCFCRYSVIIAILKREPKEFSRRVAFQLKKKKKNKNKNNKEHKDQDFFFYYLFGSGGTSGSTAVSNDFENLQSRNHTWVT